MAPAVREDIIARVRLDGVPQLQADSARAKASIAALKAEGRATSATGVASAVTGTGASAAAVEARQLAALKEMDRIGREADKVTASMNARQIARTQAATAVASRSRPAFGERGRAVATAVGGGRYAGLAAPFGGWGPLLGIAAGYSAISAVKSGVQNLGENQQLHAQTLAGIKSTGAAANVTAKHIEDLANRYVTLYGVQNETVQSAENILLTFPSIRNQAGKTNKIFDQTSLAVANVSARMGTDMPQAALQLGKALNDPVKGMGALRRIGVQFTASQEAQIKVMVASGNRLGAQKIILKELNREFGGSAALAGKTFPAAMTRLGEAWEDARNRLVIQLLPAMTTATNWMTKTLPKAANVAARAWNVAFNGGKGDTGFDEWKRKSELGGLVGWLTDDHDVSAPDKWLKKNPHPWAVAGDLIGIGDGPGKARTKRRDAQGLAERQRQQRAVGGVMLDENGNPQKGLGQSWEDKANQVNWNLGDPFANRDVILMADGQQIAKLVTKGQQKRTHAEGTGTSRR